MKKIISILLCTCLIASMSFNIIPSAYAHQSNSVSQNNEIKNPLTDTVDKGNILHCFNWYYNKIKDNLELIAEQGFSTIQVSPFQGNKSSINSGAYLCDWSFFYQPINFTGGNELGTAEDFKNLCEEAHKYGIKVIVDVVSNHMAQSTELSGRNAIGALYEGLKAPFNDKQYYHNVKRESNDSTRDLMVNYHIGGLPDLDTKNPTVQNWVYEYLKECVELGADGFRFDAAKHIETPNEYDSNLSSDYWTNTASKILKDYPHLYIYGETLSLNGLVNITSYTDIMNVTDIYAGPNAISSFYAGNVNNLSTEVGLYGNGDIPKGKSVVWVESHDEFLSGVTTKLSEDLIKKIYASLAVRKYSPCLFFMRPASNEAVSDSNWDLLFGESTNTWKSNEIKQINLFKNYFANEDEVLSKYNNFYIVERGTKGVAVINATSSTSIDLPVKNIENGTYIDQISGNTFTVENGKLTGKMNKSGIAIIYNAEKIPSVSLSINNKSYLSSDNIIFIDDTITVELKAENAGVSSYKIGNNEEVIFENTAKVTLGKNVDYGYAIPVTLTATNDKYSTEKTFYLNKISKNEKKVVYFNTPSAAFYSITKNNPYSTGYPCVYTTDANKNALDGYPGLAMTAVDDDLNPNKAVFEHLYKAELKSKTAFVKFNDGVPQTANFDAHTIPSTEVSFGDASITENCKKGGLEIIGSMIWSKNTWKSVNEDGSPLKIFNQNVETNLSTDTDVNSDNTDTDTDTLFGDANLDTKISMVDVTLIQRFIADLEKLSEDSKFNADVTGDTFIKMDDVVKIQKYIAQLIDTLNPFDKPANTDSDIISSDTETDTQTDSEISSENVRVYFKLNEQTMDARFWGWDTELHNWFWEDNPDTNNGWNNRPYINSLPMENDYYFYDLTTEQDYDNDHVYGIKITNADDTSSHEEANLSGTIYIDVSSYDNWSYSKAPEIDNSDSDSDNTDISSDNDSTNDVRVYFKLNENTMDARFWGWDTELHNWFWEDNPDTNNGWNNRPYINSLPMENGYYFYDLTTEQGYDDDHVYGIKITNANDTLSHEEVNLSGTIYINVSSYDNWSYSKSPENNNSDSDDNDTDASSDENSEEAPVRVYFKLNKNTTDARFWGWDTKLHNWFWEDNPDTNNGWNNRPYINSLPMENGYYFYDLTAEQGYDKDHTYGIKITNVDDTLSHEKANLSGTIYINVSSYDNWSFSKTPFDDLNSIRIYFRLGAKAKDARIWGWDNNNSWFDNIENAWENRPFINSLSMKDGLYYYDLSLEQGYNSTNTYSIKITDGNDTLSCTIENLSGTTYIDVKAYDLATVSKTPLVIEDNVRVYFRLSPNTKETRIWGWNDSETPWFSEDNDKTGNGWDTRPYVTSLQTFNGFFYYDLTDAHNYDQNQEYNIKISNADNSASTEFNNLKGTVYIDVKTYDSCTVSNKPFEDSIEVDSSTIFYIPILNFVK